MANKQEIISTIQEGNALVSQIYTGLSEAQAQTRVSEGGWTAKEVLSHMAGRQPAYERLIQLSQPGATPFSTPIDVDANNAALVNARRDRSLAEILAEFMTVHEWLIQQVQALPDEALDQVISLPQIQMPLGDLLGRAGGTHSVMHMKEVQQALSKAAAG